MFSDVKSLPQNAEPGDSQTFGLSDTIMEPKLDGIRILAHIGGDFVKTYTRTGKEQTGKLPKIELALRTRFPAGTWLDGEVVGFNDDGSQDWGAAQSCLGSGVQKAAKQSGSMVYMIFDMLAYDGLDIRRLSLKERHNSLETAWNAWSGFKSESVRLVEWQANTEKNYDKLVAAGYEGAMVKRTDTPYASGQRGAGWYKIKATDEADVVIMGFKPGENGFVGMVGAIEFGQYFDQGALGVNLIHRGRCSGMDMAMRKHMTEHEAEYVGCVISVSYMGIMPSGALRHSQFKRLRDDKPAADCLWTYA